MMFMNEHEIADAAERYRDHPILGPATRTLRNLAEWTNENSDGWPYWSKPIRAAARLQEMITRDGTHRYRFDEERGIRESVATDQVIPHAPRCELRNRDDMIRKILFGLAVWIVLLGVSFLVGLALAVLGVPPLLCVAAFVATFAGLVWLLKESATIDRWFNEIG
jgi:hypothetical protein